MERNELRAQILKAMAHPSRLTIMEALAREERCVCDLKQLVGSDISTVSKHLSVLKNAGLVEDRKAGLQVFYRLRVPCVMQFFGCIEAVLEDRVSRISGNSMSDNDQEVCSMDAGVSGEKCSGRERNRLLDNGVPRTKAAARARLPLPSRQGKVKT